MIRTFGHIPGVLEGDSFQNRIELALAKVHPPLQSGISGSQSDGADSIILSGGYEDDKDFGDVIVYTGQGGRNIESGKQVSNQLLSKQNLALAKSCQLGLPVRVVRGFTHKSRFSPAEGYRYDGLFYVEKYWKDKGKSGFDVWRFRLIKVRDLQTFSEIIEESVSSLNEELTDYSNGSTKRKETLIQRLIRDTKVGRMVKELYHNRCQVCNQSIPTNAGSYAEAAHIQPLGIPHNGPDILENVLCLCPNHHVMFDFSGFSIADDFQLLGLEGKLSVNEKHKIGIEFLQYHRKHFWE